LGFFVIAPLDNSFDLDGALSSRKIIMSLACDLPLESIPAGAGNLALDDRFVL
jgi:hypothetical protein